MSDQLTKEQWKESQERFFQACESALKSMYDEMSKSFNGKTEFEKNLSDIPVDELFIQFTI